MKYYKAMNKDMSCRGFQYEIGKTYNLRRNQNLELCKRGFHFCDILANCFNYYEKYNSIICEVEPLGRIIHSENENKLVTDRIKIVRQLSNEEIKKEQYVIQDGIEMIGDSCFNYCTDLKEINIPNSVTYIGENAFYNCELLEKINIPNSVTSIDECAFYCCTSLKKITIPNSVTWIGALSLGYNEYNYITQKRDKIEDFTIYGFKGSTAETYATENDFNFIAIDNDTQPTTTDILKLKKYILGISNDITNLDFNQDNNVNILDLNVAKQSILYKK